jgi:hypothetical protein
MIDGNAPGSTPTDSSTKTPDQPPRRRGLWCWFVAGFLLVFVGLSMIVNQYWMDPSGEFLERGKLWQ